MNNINSNLKKEKEQKEITVILGKLAGDGYSYLEDSLHERSKIKIPLVYDQQSDFKTSVNEEFSHFKEKSISESQKYSSSASNMNMQKNIFNESKNEEMPKNEHFNADSEMHEFKCVFGDGDKNSYLIPNCSQWFKLDDINDIEMKGNPEFFTGKFPSKTPDVYKEYRNYIVNLFRENPNSYLSSTTCRRHLAGDACSILRIHSFLEHWGIINFNVDPSNKPTNPILAKSYNYRNPVYVDAASFIVKETTPNFANKIGDNSIVLTNKTGEEIKTLYPINNNPENLFRSIFNKNALNPNNKLNFIAKNYRPKCDMCNKLCGIEWYMLKNSSLESKDLLVVCDTCFETGNIPKDLKAEDFEVSNIYGIVDPNQKYERNLKEKFETEKWSLNDTLELIDNLEKYGENWDEIIKNLSTQRTKNECILHIMQLPIKENVVFKFTDVKLNKETNSSFLNQKNGEISESSKLLYQVKDCNALSDQSNPIIQQIVFFAKMFENFSNNDLKKSKEEIEAEFHTKINPNSSYQDFILNSLNEKREFLNIDSLKDLIYRTYSKPKDNSKAGKNEEKKKMKKIMSLIIYLQMRKIEMKLNYFNEIEKLIQSENQQLKSMESQIIQDRIKVALKKSEINQLAKKFRDIINPLNSGNSSLNKNINFSNIHETHGNNIDKNLELNEEEKKGGDRINNLKNNSELHKRNNIGECKPNIKSDKNGDISYSKFNSEAPMDIERLENDKNIIQNTQNREINEGEDFDIKLKLENNSAKKHEKKDEIDEQSEKKQVDIETNEHLDNKDNRNLNKTPNKNNKDENEEEVEENEEEGEFEEIDEEEADEEMEEENEQEFDDSREQYNEKKETNKNKDENEANIESENNEVNNNIETLNFYKGEEGESENENENENDENSNTNNDNEENNME